MKILVFGGRDYKNWQAVYAALDQKLIEHGDELIVIHGDCHTGADRFAGQWARQAECDYVCVPAKWKKYLKPAGPIRNRRMAEKYKPDLALQFPGGTGTADMRSVCDAIGIQVHEHG